MLYFDFDKSRSMILENKTEVYSTSICQKNDAVSQYNVMAGVSKSEKFIGNIASKRLLTHIALFFYIS